jgi:hypothetical protein
MRSVKRSHLQPQISPASRRVFLGFTLLTLATLTSSLHVNAQSAGRISGKYSGRIEASADAGPVFNLFMGDRDFDFNTEIQFTEDASGRVNGNALFIDQKNRRSEGAPSGQRNGSRLRVSIPLRANCAPIQTKAVISTDGDVLSFSASKQTLKCVGSGINVDVVIKLKAFTLAK